MFSKAALSTRTTSVAVTVFIGFFALFSVVFGGIGLYVATIRPVASIIAARSWVATPCTIIASAVTEHRGSEGRPTYSLEITYSYVFKGKPQQSDRYDFLSGSSSVLAGGTPSSTLFPGPRHDLLRQSRRSVAGRHQPRSEP